MKGDFQNKKLLAMALSLVMVFTMTACGSGSTSGEVIKIEVMQFGKFTALQNAYDGFVQGLEEAGYVDGENIKINLQSAAADTANCPTIADTLINDESDLIFAIATPSVSCLKEKTKDIPVLFSAVTDPVESGLIKDINVPGGNISGTSDMNPVKEQIDLLKELLPDAKKVAVFYCSSETNSAAQYKLAKKQIEALGMECVQKTISAIDERVTFCIVIIFLIVKENNLTTLMVIHNMQNAIDYGNRLIMMHEGKVVFDVKGEEKKKLKVKELIEKFNEFESL